MDTDTEEKPRLSTALDKFIRRVGNITAWLSILLIIVIIVQVILRYGFGHGLVALEELQWHLYAIMFMIALSYDVVLDAHIRLDVFHSRFSRRRKEKIEIAGILFLLMPMIIIIFLHSLDFFEDSWRVSERSDAPLGLPYRWALKAFIPIGMTLFAAAAVSRLISAIRFLRKDRAKDGNQ